MMTSSLERLEKREETVKRRAGNDKIELSWPLKKAVAETREAIRHAFEDAPAIRSRLKRAKSA
jgi:hypothetical protein